MRARPSTIRAKRRVALDAAMGMVIILLMAQMWLLTAALESLLAGHHETLLPAMVVSGLLFLAGVGFYVMVVRLDRVPEPDTEPRSPGPWEIGAPPAGAPGAPD